jgi:hypothetical protein
MEEYEALLFNSTWDLIYRPPGANVVTDKWIFKYKLKRMALLTDTRLVGFSDGSLSAPEWITMRPSALSSSLSPSGLCWLWLSLGVGPCTSSTSRTPSSTALSETVYCSQPTSFVDPAHPQLVCRFNKSLYGLKQASWVWYHCFASYLVSLGFVEAKSDISLFVYRHGADTAYLLLYVNDIVLIASSPELL